MDSDPRNETLITLRVPGVPEESPALPRTEAIKVESRARVRLGAARGADGYCEIPGVRADDVAVLEYSNGFRLWTRVDDLYREQVARSSRGMANFDSLIWEIDPRASSVAGERGLAGLAIEALEIVGIDVAGASAKALTIPYEKNHNAQLRQHYTDALYRVDLNQALPSKSQALPRVEGEIQRSDEQAILIFLHGTGSSLQGGFGHLWDETLDAGRDARLAMFKQYGDNVFAFEHRSIAASPIANALALAEQLPAKANLHLITHSRGGLIGDLLCLGQRLTASDPLKDEFLQDLFKRYNDFSEAEGDEGTEYAQFLALLKVLDGKQIVVSRFVRLACPAAGTSLVSGRLDRWLSMLDFLALAGGPVVETAVDFLLAVVKERTNPRSLPGLAAMMPGSALTKLLNHPQLEVAADLTVIAGDCVGDSVYSRLKLLVADWFFDSDHDLVVNTASMYGGPKRGAGRGRFALERGADVNHFNYFKNAKTVKLLWEALSQETGVVGSFAPLTQARPQPTTRAAEIRSAVDRSGSQGPRPVVFVLPGTMGSGLKVGDDRIWLNFPRLALGGLALLDPAATDVRPDGLLEDYYGDLIEFFTRTHEVIPFAYDWRLSIEKSADALVLALSPKLAQCEANQQALRLVAHSMGGLVVRMMIAKNPSLWKRICALPGSRFIMLGTPNYGSYEAVRWLTGWNPTLEKLDTLDVTHNIGELVNFVRSYPGLLELLPSKRSGVRDFSNPKIWEQLRGDLTEAQWKLPLPHLLQAAARTWSQLRDQDLDPQHMIYVAGCAPETICDVVLAADRGLFTGTRPKVTFKANGKGDGTVPWELGILPGVPLWYLHGAAHDQLTTVASAFPAYLELLQTGTTTRLPKQPPQARAGEADAWEYLPRMPDRLPDAADRLDFVLGIPARHGASTRKRASRAKISLCHGHLGYARYPVCVGHYRGDTIVSAEAELDFRLNGKMSERQRLGVYPGDSGTCALFITSSAHEKPGGVIIIGLGQVGQLTPGRLEAAMSQAMLEYAIKVAGWQDDRFGAIDSPRSASVTCLLVGTGAGGLTVRDSLSALLHGIKNANQRLADAEWDHQVLIDQVEFLELYEDTAILAARELAEIVSAGPLGEAFDWPVRAIRSGSGGRRRVAFEDPPNWWHRLEICHDPSRDVLRFIALTKRARAETTTSVGQLQLADAFVQQAVAVTSNSEDISKTLFEMLIPNELKQVAPDNLNVVLLVDELSARYPWELLEDRWSVNGKPPAVAAGMLRQFKTEQFRAVVAHGTEKIAFVVGNPKIPPPNTAGSPRFLDLPGAVKEAVAVKTALESNGFRVVNQINANARDILAALHGNAYRILHLAGHGVHQLVLPGRASSACDRCGQVQAHGERRVSGMVIGDLNFLTAGDVEQMRWVPELVFINCCFLGSMQAPEAERRRAGELAANLAGQFIRMGVKAVIAAGWAVSDDAAECFAQGFYQHFLAGGTFGDAVRMAREATYDRFRDVNTWGAYQCYGDPAYRLDGADAPENQRKRLLTPYFLRTELVTELENLVEEIHISRIATDWGERIDALLAVERFPSSELKESWLKEADVAAALGEIYGELGCYREAIDHLDTALAANHAQVSVKAMEQRANYRIKLALEEFLAAPKTSVKRGARKTSGVRSTEPAQAEIVASIHELQFLCGRVMESGKSTQVKPSSGHLMEASATLERLSLIGNGYKRLAWLLASGNGAMGEIRDVLDKMAESYEEAFRRSKPEVGGGIKPCPLCNWVAAQALRATVKPGAKNADGDLKKWWKENSTHIVQWLEQARQDALRKEREDPDFWNAVTQADCLLALYVLQEVFNKAKPPLSATATTQQIADIYQQAFRRGATPRNRAIVIEHLDFLLALPARLDSGSELWSGIETIREALKH